jgi:hypothetical protein
MKKNTEIQDVAAALNYILPILEKYKLHWCLSGPLAFYIYGVDCPINSIDIDIEIDKDDPKFQSLIKDVKPFTQLPFQLWIDENYDNWVMNVIINKKMLSLCTTPDLKLFNKESGKYELFYPHGIPKTSMVEFEGLKLPVAPKELVLKMRQALAYKKVADEKMISNLEKLL